MAMPPTVGKSVVAHEQEWLQRVKDFASLLPHKYGPDSFPYKMWFAVYSKKASTLQRVWFLILLRKLLLGLDLGAKAYDRCAHCEDTLTGNNKHSTGVCHACFNKLSQE